MGKKNKYYLDVWKYNETWMGSKMCVTKFSLIIFNNKEETKTTVLSEETTYWN